MTAPASVARSGVASVLALIENQVRVRPHHLAVICGDHRLTYLQLSERSNRVALALRKAGADDECLVGVFLDRSADLITALLGIWKAGAAYLPLDPIYPPERLSFMVEDSRVSILLTEKGRRASSLPR